LSLTHPRPRSTLFPYTTLFRSRSEGPRRSGHNLVVRHVAQVLREVPAVPERIVELAVQVAPEHLCERLADLRAGRDGLRKHRLRDRKSTRLNSSHLGISYAVFC